MRPASLVVVALDDGDGACSAQARGAAIMATEDRLKELGLTLPVMPSPLASYVPWVRTGNLVFLSGHVPFQEDMKTLHTGKVGDAFSTEEAAELAKREEGHGVTAYSVDPGIVATAMWSCKEDEPGHAAGWPLNAKCGNAYTLGISEEEYAQRVADNAKSLNAPTAEFSGGAATLAWLAAAPRVGAHADRDRADARGGALRRLTTPRARGAAKARRRSPSRHYQKIRHQRGALP